jgi:SWI/SNF-related matrix-associated actin-dependent regulator 1 of chromatin subfamily A
MRLIRQNSKIVAIAQFSEKDTLKSAGFRWEPSQKHWWTDNLEVAAKLKRYASPEVVTMLEESEKKKKESIELSRATDVDIDIPTPDGLQFRPFQKAGIAYALTRPATLIGDDMGLGKTLEAIGVINADDQIKSVLIVSPLLVKINWKRELEKWLTRELSIGLADTKSWPEDVAIVIIHPNALVAQYGNTHAKVWDLVVVDEAHMFKAKKAQRTRALFGTYDEPGVQGKRKLCLTGTPIPNRPVELHPIVEWLDPTNWGNWRRFVTRYCDASQTQYGWDTKGASNLHELQEKLRATVMIRRRKDDVLTELPPKQRQVIVLDPRDVKNGAKAVKAEATALAKHEVQILKAQLKAELARLNSKEYAQAVKELKAVTSESIGVIAEMRHKTALVKVPAVAEHVSELLDGDESQKITVWAHHKDVVAGLEEHLEAYGVVKITGDVSMEDRDVAVEQFQNDPSVRVFIGSITAAGIGITLTAASMSVFAELSWVPGDVTQAEDRIHRIGQTESVLIQHIVLDESIDARLAKVLVSKQEVADQALDNQADPDDDVTIDLLVQAGSEPEPEQDSKPVEEDTVQISDKEIKELQRKIRLLAGLDDDRAQEKNGVGFNKIDSEIGHILADAPKWTQRMASIARQLVNRYHRQLA